MLIMMTNFDTDGDGVVSKEEFLTSVRDWMVADFCLVVLNSSIIRFV